MPDSLPFDPTRKPELDKPGKRKPLTQQAPVGAAFAYWTVLEQLPARHGHRYLRCRCVCGEVRDLMGGHVVRGKSTSCGCKHARDGNRTHGLSDTRTHVIWMNMRDRCRRPGNKNYADYGGRGIRVCERWEQFEAFFADMGEAPAGLSLERRDNDGNYSPDNCVWASRKVQARNQRRTVRISHNGRTMALVGVLALVQGVGHGFEHPRVLEGPLLQGHGSLGGHIIVEPAEQGA